MTSRHRLTAASLFTCSALLLAACGSDTTTGQGAPAESSTAPATAANPATSEAESSSAATSPLERTTAPTTTSTTSTSSSDETPIDSTSAPAPSTEGVLTFEAGTELSSTVRLGWSDPLMLKPDEFRVSVADNGQGRWTYLHVESGCEVGFWNGVVTDLDTSVGDEKLTDALLTTLVKLDPAELDGLAPGQPVEFDYLGDRTMQTRAIEATKASGGKSIWAARGFATPAVGVFAGLTCPVGVEPLPLWEQLRTEHDAFRVVVVG